MYVRLKVAAGKTAQDYEDPCETVEVSELCSVYSRLSLHSVFETSAEKWAVGKYCFCRGAKRKAQSRQKRKRGMYLPLTHTHILRKKHAARVLIFPILSFPS